MIVTSGSVVVVPPPIIVTPPADGGNGFSLPQQLSIVLTGIDGSVWDLVAGPVYLAPQAGGFGTVAPNHWWSVSPTVDGSTHQGMRVPQRDFPLPVFITDGSSLGYRDIEVAFFNAIGGGDQLCTITVTSPDKPDSPRMLQVRYDDGGDEPQDSDPLLLRYSAWPLQMTADIPYWQGPEVSATYTPDVSVPFLGTSGGPPIYIGASSNFDSASVTNPGDVAAPPRWTANGECSNFTVGIGDALVSMDVTLTGSQQIVVDMDPRVDTPIVDDQGNDRWDDLTDVAFADVPPGLVDLTTQVDGQGADTSIEVAFTPLYRRAVG